MKKIIHLVVVILLVVTFGFPEETSFSRVAVPVLTFSDEHKAVEVKPAKGTPVSIPYSEIDKFSYEYTKKHRINEESIFTAPVGGAIVMLTKAKTHWLEIDYREGTLPKSFMVRMDKREYLHILEAVKAHTGQDAEVLGNADKKRRK